MAASEARCSQRIADKAAVRAHIRSSKVRWDTIDPSVLLRSFHINTSLGYTTYSLVGLGPKTLHALHQKRTFQAKSPYPMLCFAQQCMVVSILTHLHRNGCGCLQFTPVGFHARLCNFESRSPAPHDEDDSLLALQRPVALWGTWVTIYS